MRDVPVALSVPRIVGQVKARWVAPTLALLPRGWGGQAAVELVTGTGAAESLWFQFIGQSGGPAVGFWNMEPATHDDCWGNYIRYQPDLQRALLTLLGGAKASAELMQTRMDYAIAMCRVKYYRAPEPLPAAGDAAAQAAYHKRWYNTALGKADPAANLPYFIAGVTA